MCESFDAAQRILDAALEKEDTRILLEVQSNPDCIATDTVYHRSCYAKFTLCTTQSSRERSETASAFDVVADVIDNEILQQDGRGGIRAVTIQFLRSKFVARLEALGRPSPNYKTELVKARILNQYQGRVKFVRSSVTEPEKVIAAHLSEENYIGLMTSVIGDLGGRTEEDDEVFMASAAPATSEMDLFHAAIMVHHAVREVEPVLTSTPHATEITKESVARCVPVVLHNFLAWVIGGPDVEACVGGLAEVNERVGRLVDSISQDIVYAASNGRVVPPKHIALAMTTRHLTRSQQLVTMLNRFGHSVSATRVSEVETALAMEVRHSETRLPSTVTPNNAIFFCSDNNDRNEETLDGKGTMHATATIVLQNNHPSPELPAPGRTPDVSAANGPLLRSSRRPRALIPSERLTLPLFVPPRSIASPHLSASGLTETQSTDALAPGEDLDIVWLLLRSTQATSRFGRSAAEPQEVPPWSGFNASVACTAVQPVTRIAYLPLIPESPTDGAVVGEVIQRCVLMARSHGQSHCILTCDQAMYAKAVQVMSQKRDAYPEVVLRMGSFHTILSFLGVIGKRFADGGLSDLLVDAGVVGPSACRAALSGKHYNRAIRMHKLAFEALWQCRWEVFERTLEHAENGGDLQHIEDAICALRDSGIYDAASMATKSSAFAVLKADYCRSSQQEASKPSMASYWLSYLEMISLLLQFIRATRTGDWNLHLACVRKLLPWFYAYDHQHYARYLTMYWCDMVRLPDTNPSASEALKAGDFTATRSSKSFAKVPVDQTIEQTFNRDSKTPGGIVGFSRNKGAVERWVLTAHECAAVTSACYSLAGLDRDNSSTTHKDSTKHRMTRDQHDVEAIGKVLSEYGNPYQPGDLVNLATRDVPSASVQKDLHAAQTVGENAVQEFIANRMVTDGSSISDVLKKNKLETFKAPAKRKKSSRACRADTALQQVQLFQQLVVMAQVRTIDMRLLLTHELGTLPLSLAQGDGTPVTTQKSKLMALLEQVEDVAEAANSIPDGCALVIDAMAMLRAQTSLPPTFGQLSEQVLKYLVKLLVSHRSSRLDFVADEYHTNSIKSFERQSRSHASAGHIRRHVQRPDQAIPTDWSRFMTCGENKTDLVQFFADQWAEHQAALLLHPGQSIYVTVGVKSWRLEAKDDGQFSASVEPLLECTHEEADTRMFLHAEHSLCRGASSVCIFSQDTDVFVLALAHSASLHGTVYILTGQKSKRRVLNVTAIADKLGPTVCGALIGLHAFTGCDAISAFSGKGKARGLKLVKGNGNLAGAMAALGQSFAMQESIFNGCKQFVCALYGATGSSADVNGLRYKLFCDASKARDPRQLPPCEDALLQHARRANYQAAIWKSALQRQPDQPSPDGQGWTIEAGQCMQRNVRWPGPMSSHFKIGRTWSVLPDHHHPTQCPPPRHLSVLLMYNDNAPYISQMCIHHQDFEPTFKL